MWRRLESTGVARPVGSRFRPRNHARAGVLAACAWLLAGAAPVDAAICPNEAVRVGASANLARCRAYELVTPEDANGLAITVKPMGESNGFDTWLASNVTDSVIFNTVSGSLPGFDGNGVFDQYEATRTGSGWETRLVAPSGAQSEGPHPGGVSADHRYSFWRTTGFPEDRGSLQVDESSAGDGYLRKPDGRFEPIGKGSLSIDWQAEGLWIGNGGSHVIFASPAHLEPNAPPSAVTAVYDRPVGGPTHVVSLLPGDATPTGDADYQGHSADGSAISFKAGGKLYERRDSHTTLEVADETSFPVGESLTCEGGPADAESLQFQWLRSGEPIPSAISPTYTTTPGDAGSTLQCQVFALNANAGSIKVSTPAIVVSPAPATQVPVPPTNLPNLTPTEPEAGTVETCSTGAWAGNPSFEYQWYVNGAAIPGATGNTYSVGASDVPSALQCAVTGTNSGGAVTIVTRLRLTKPAPNPPAPTASAVTPLSLGLIFAGISADGGRVFYQRFGDAFVFDAAAQTTTRIAPVATIVNIAPDGSRVYFTSPEQLDDAKGDPGSRNLYLWDGGTPRFIGVLAAADFESFSGTPLAHLGLWTIAVGPEQTIQTGPASTPSRTTPDGSVFVFQSHANLTPPYDSLGHSEVFRYDAASSILTCVSCNPDGSPPNTDAQLQAGVGEPERDIPTTELSHVAGVTDDGETVFFQTRESLLDEDVDGVLDVYEWHLGQLSLIGWGHSGADDYIYGMTPDGTDVFFATSDTLAPGDRNGSTRKVYDARVGGGFPSSAPPPQCEGDACQGQPASPPGLSDPVTTGLAGKGNVRRPCVRRRAGQRRRGGAQHRRRRARSAARGSRRCGRAKRRGQQRGVTR
jgi:hypothetical protein